MAIPTVVSVGTTTAGVGAIEPPWGTHASGDLGLLFVETVDQAVTPTDWLVVPNSPILNVALTTRLSVFYRFATSAAESAPVVADPGEHAVGVVITFNGVDATNPFHAIAGMGGAGATASGSFPALLTSVNDCLIVHAMSWNLDNAGPIAGAATNALLASITEQHDAGTLDGNGGGIVVITATLAAAGPTGATTATFTAAGAASMTIALQPAPIAATFTVADTVTIDGVPAADGTTVEIWDDTLKARETSCLVAGGAGAFTALVRFNDADRYFCTYDDGTNYGRSALDTAV